MYYCFPEHGACYKTAKMFIYAYVHHIMHVIHGIYILSNRWIQEYTITVPNATDHPYMPSVPFIIPLYNSKLS